MEWTCRHEACGIRYILCKMNDVKQELSDIKKYVEQNKEGSNDIQKLDMFARKMHADFLAELKNIHSRVFDTQDE